jgi:WD40 repeat protein
VMLQWGCCVYKDRHEDSIYSIVFTPDGKCLVSGSLDKTLKYWDIAVGKERKVGNLAAGNNQCSPFRLH